MQKRAEKRARIEHTVTRLLSESATLAVALRNIIEMICAEMHFACGVRWRRDENDDSLHCLETWGLMMPWWRRFQNK